MKIRLLVSIVILALTVSTVCAKDIVEWEDIAPNGYANPTYIKNETFFCKHPYATAFTSLTIIGIPFVLHTVRKNNGINENNYWYARKKEFESQKEMCKLIKNEDKRTECLINLRQNELQTTETRNYAKSNNSNNSNFQPRHGYQTGNTIFLY